MNNIELRIMGGLGNQLYQYAAARYVQSIVSKSEIVIDVGGYKNYLIRNLELNSILDNKSVSFRETQDTINQFVRKCYHVHQKLYNIVFRKHIPMSIHKLANRTYVLSSIDINKDKLYKISGDVYMYGYFVTAEIPLIMKDMLMKEIVAPESSSEKYVKYRELIRKQKAVGVSIRCAMDYVDNGWPVCTRDYYISGMRKVLRNNPDAIFVIFADDMEKVKEEKWFDGFPIMYIENLSVCESFDLLRECYHYVCSNSSFSWWGAFLSRNENSLIYSPNYVFADERENNRTILPNMIILDYITGELCEEVRG